jgi:predicted peroxiredoxin
MADKEKILLMCTHGPEDAERATIPFVIATAAQASDVEAVIGFQVNGVLLVRKGCAEHVFAPGFPPLKDLMDAFIEAGGKIFVCGPCVTSRKLNPQTDFIEGATVVNAATFVKEITESKNVLIY